LNEFYILDEVQPHTIFFAYFYWKYVFH